MKLPVRFNYTCSEINKIVDDSIKESRHWIKSEMESDKSPSDMYKSFLESEDKSKYKIGVIHFLQNVSPSKKIRDTCTKGLTRLDNYSQFFFENVKYYNFLCKLKLVKFSSPKRQQVFERWLDAFLKSFENNGIHLPTDKKKKFNESDKALNLNVLNFSKNIRNDNPKLFFTEKQIQGLPKENFQNYFNSKSKKYVFDTSYPDHYAIMTNCSNSISRKKMLMTFENVAYPKNLKVLEKMLEFRLEKARILGFNTTPDYYFANNRLAKQDDINNLIKKIGNKVYNATLNDYKKKCKEFGFSEMHDYDIAFYNQKYLIKNYNVSNEQIASFFPSDVVIPRVFRIYGDLFGLEFKKTNINKTEKWAPNVQLYTVYDKITKKSNKHKSDILGYLYLDLYPRPGKYTHAATFHIQSPYISPCNKRVIPVTAMVCNFTEPMNNRKFANWQFSEVETFCHELGHCIHELVSKVEIQGLSGTKTELDFVETVSQIMENWCYDKTFLKKISWNHQLKKPIPTKYIHTIQAVRKATGTTQYARQLVFLSYDLAIHSLPKEKITKRNLVSIWRNLTKKYIPYKITPGTHHMCRFDHLTEYECGYYSYLWSVIYAFDAFSEFEKKGLFSKKVGYRFRKQIMEKGGSEKGTVLLKNFLGRETNEKAFMKHLTT